MIRYNSTDLTLRATAVVQRLQNNIKLDASFSRHLILEFVVIITNRHDYCMYFVPTIYYIII